MLSAWPIKRRKMTKWDPSGLKKPLFFNWHYWGNEKSRHRWGEFCKSYSLQKIIPRVYKELKLNKHPNRRGPNGLNRYFNKDKHMTRCSPSLVTRTTNQNHSEITPYLFEWTNGILFSSVLFCTTLQSLWVLSSPTKDPGPLAGRARNLNYWNAREFPGWPFFLKKGLTIPCFMRMQSSWSCHVLPFI